MRCEYHGECFGYGNSKHTPTTYVTHMFLEADDALFGKILHDKAHVLHSFLPDRPDIVYSLRARSHNKSLMCKTSDLNERSF